VTVRLTPNAGVDRIDGVVDGAVRARVAARPIEGQANKALGDLIAGALGISRSRVTIVRGATGRVKTVELEGVERALVRSRWPGVEV
jgi:uncharacterized protein YggU (UPF0235/DUF167 family)